jgi:hypothetical protein
MLEGSELAEGERASEVCWSDYSVVQLPVKDLETLPQVLLVMGVESGKGTCFWPLLALSSLNHCILASQGNPEVMSLVTGEAVAQREEVT